MPFDIAICWIVAAASIGALTWMGTRNYRAGYRRERTDIPADLLMLWAAAAASEAADRPSAAVSRVVPPAFADPVSQSASAVQHSSDLIALGAFAGMAQPVVVAEDHPAAATAAPHSPAEVSRTRPAR